MRAAKALFKTAATLCACCAIAAGTFTVANRSAPPAERTVTATVAAKTAPGAAQAETAEKISETNPAGIEPQNAAPVQNIQAAKPSCVPVELPTLASTFHEAAASALPAPDSVGRLLESYMANGRLVRVFLEPLADGNKELVVQITEPDGGSRAFRTGIAVDEAGQCLFGLNGKGLLNTGFNFDYGQSILYYSEVVFQRKYGYCELYDILAPLISADFLTVRFKFEYAGMDWMIQFWKGIYFFNTTGGEVGVYNKPQSRPCEFYDCGRDEDQMPISVTVLRNGEVIFRKPLEVCWWQTGFALREPCPKEELTLQSTLVFPAEEMRTAFTQAVDAAAAEDFSYTVDGNAVSVVW